MTDPTTKKASAHQARLTAAAVVLATLGLGFVFPPAWVVTLLSAGTIALLRTSQADFWPLTCANCGGVNEVRRELEHFICDSCGAIQYVDTYTGRVRMAKDDVNGDAANEGGPRHLRRTL